jgi:hypothetical protein
MTAQQRTGMVRARLQARVLVGFFRVISRRIRTAR